MKQESSFTDSSSLYVGKLKGIGWVEPAKSFYNNVRASLPQTRQGQLLERSDDYFAGLLAGKTGDLFVAIDEGQIKAMVCLVRPGTLADACKKGYVTAPHAQELLDLPKNDKVGVVSSFCACKSAKGKRFPARLLHELTASAQEQGLCHLVAQTGQNNLPSWLNFLKAGFGLVSAWKPKGDHARFLMYMPSTHLFKNVSELDVFDYFVPRKKLAARALLPLFRGHLKAGRSVALKDTASRPDHYHFIFG